MHRTLKDATTTPPEANWRRQQQSFDAFRREYNDERPHQSLGQQTPAEHYQPSPRVYPFGLPRLEYPESFIIRQVHHRGYLRFSGFEIYLSLALGEEWIGLDQEDDDGGVAKCSFPGFRASRPSNEASYVAISQRLANCLGTSNPRQSGNFVILQHTQLTK